MTKSEEPPVEQTVTCMTCARDSKGWSPMKKRRQAAFTLIACRLETQEVRLLLAVLVEQGPPEVTS